MKKSVFTNHKLTVLIFAILFCGFFITKYLAHHYINNANSFQKSKTDLSDKFYGPVVIDLEGLTLTKEEKQLLQYSAIGGVILFDKNLEDRQQLINLIQEIRSIRKKILIMVDHEGGFIQRFQREGFRAIPSFQVLGKTYDLNQETGLNLTKIYGKIMAEDLIKLNIDLGLTPVLDLDNGNVVISGLDRAFHKDPQAVIHLANAHIAGIKEAKMASIGKHFPGHGSVLGDSHLMYPVDSRAYPEIEKTDLIPFIQLIKENKLNAIMPSHVLYPEIDKENTVGYSKIWLQDILRKKLGFTGVIISDALCMKAAKKDNAGPKEMIEMAIEAGCDLVLLTNQSRKDLFTILNATSVTPNPDAQERIKALAIK